MAAVPAFIRDLSDEDALDIQMVENLQRADLHPIEEADGYRALMAHGATAEDVARKAGKTLGYVQQRLKLLTLEVDAKQVFLDGHLTLGHALLLARLTPKDQVAALLYLLGIRDWEMGKLSASEMIAQRATVKPLRPDAGTWERQNHAVQAARRRIEPTEAQLREWIGTHVLLQLGTAPWDLGDATLFPIAGPCTTCPKRTGANAALFQDITTDQDTCTDPVCFADKQKLFVIRARKLASEAGTPLLKISAKSGHERLQQKPVIVEHGAATVVAKKAVKDGQWLAAEQGACTATVAAIHVDGAKTGQTAYVCADQNCKVHKHQVDRPVPKPGTTGPISAAAVGRSAEAEAALELYRKRERAVRVAVANAIIDTGKVDFIGTMRELVQDELDNSYQLDYRAIAEVLVVEIPDSAGDEAAMTALSSWIARVQMADLLELVFVLRKCEDLFEVGSEASQHREREQMEKFAKQHGLGKIAAIINKAEKLHDALAQPKAVAAPPVVKRPSRSTLTPEQRKRIAEVQKQRWAQRRDGKSAAAGDVTETAGA